MDVLPPQNSSLIFNPTTYSAMEKNRNTASKTFNNFCSTQNGKSSEARKRNAKAKFSLPTILIDLVIEMKNFIHSSEDRTLTIIGGNVFRVNNIPAFLCKYIFGSFAQNFGASNGELFIANSTGPHLRSFHVIELTSNPDDMGHYLEGAM